MLKAEFFRNSSNDLCASFEASHASPASPFVNVIMLLENGVDWKWVTYPHPDFKFSDFYEQYQSYLAQLVMEEPTDASNL